MQLNIRECNKTNYQNSSCPFFLYLFTCSSWITSLDHEVTDDSVELDAVVVAPPRQLSKVSAGVGRMLPVELYEDRAHAAATIILLQ